MFNRSKKKLKKTFLVLPPLFLVGHRHQRQPDSVKAVVDVTKGYLAIFVTPSLAAVWAPVCETSERGTCSFHAVAAWIKATRWWQCCCGQNEIPPAVSVSTLELHALMQSGLTEWDAALYIPMFLKGIYLIWLFLEQVKEKCISQIVQIYLEG